MLELFILITDSANTKKMALAALLLSCKSSIIFYFFYSENETQLLFSVKKYFQGQTLCNTINGTKDGTYDWDHST